MSFEEKMFYLNLRVKKTKSQAKKIVNLEDRSCFLNLVKLLYAK